MKVSVWLMLAITLVFGVISCAKEEATSKSKPPTKKARNQPLKTASVLTVQTRLEIRRRRAKSSSAGRGGKQANRTANGPHGTKTDKRAKKGNTRTANCTANGPNGTGTVKR